MRDYDWKSDFGPLLKEYLKFKHATGFKFETQECHLQHFDHFYYYNGYQGTVLTKAVIDEFIYREEERPSTHRNKEIIMNRFADWLLGKGYHAYLPAIQTQVPTSRYMPHIYTREELGSFFHAVDTYPETVNSFRNKVDPVLFRFLYGTGTRISEALALTLSDVSIPESLIIVRQSKNGKSRIVPTANTLNCCLASYIGSFHKDSTPDCYVFPGKNRGRMDKSTAYNHFRDYLLMADIPHTGNGPRIHDFRHGLAVENLRRWANAGADLSNMLPYLSAYMGHSDFRATQYYLRLTAEIHPELVRMVEAACHDVIPEGDFLYEKS